MFEKEGKSLDLAGMKAMASAWSAITLMSVTMPKSAKPLASRLQFLFGPYPTADEKKLDDTFARDDPGKFAIIKDKAWLNVLVPALCSLLDRVTENADSLTTRSLHLLGGR